MDDIKLKRRAGRPRKDAFTEEDLESYKKLITILRINHRGLADQLENLIIDLIKNN